jgi:hypothetical protein
MSLFDGGVPTEAFAEKEFYLVDPLTSETTDAVLLTRKTNFLYHILKCCPEFILETSFKQHQFEGKEIIKEFPVSLQSF